MSGDVVLCDSCQRRSAPLHVEARYGQRVTWRSCPTCLVVEVQRMIIRGVYCVGDARGRHVHEVLLDELAREHPADELASAAELADACAQLGEVEPDSPPCEELVPLRALAVKAVLPGVDVVQVQERLQVWDYLIHARDPDFRDTSFDPWAWPALAQRLRWRSRPRA